MGSFLRNKLQDLILVGSPRVGFHPAIPYHRQVIHPIIKEHAQYVSCDRAIVNGLIVCKICQQIFTNARWNKKFILKHFQQIHNLPSTEHPNPRSSSIPKLESVSVKNTAENIPKLDKGQVNITSERSIASANASKEGDGPLPYELIVIDDDVSTSTPAKIPESNPPTKKKRGRKPKIRPEGTPTPAKKRLSSKDRDLKLKKRAMKNKILKKDEASSIEWTCSQYLS